MSNDLYAVARPGERYFSVAEANALVPLLQRTFEDVRTARAAMRGHLSALRQSGDEPDPLTLEPAEGAAPDVVARYRDLRDLRDQVLDRLRQLSELGVEIKGADGLCDVRSRFQGRIVYLCWQAGEEQFASWHELDAGFVGRQPIGDASAFEGSLLN
ncbi:MAG TPA: DUF2203 domain-containing protein [Myxococcota bacterium]|jgi:hypothetical protein|nr:DUF2203 domain-containing protein [Myxococcota bacterium]